MFKFIPNNMMMKKILLLLFFPFSVFAQEQLSLDNILTISDKNSFLKEVIENGYSEGNSTKDKIYYGKGFKKEKTQATDWAEYTLASGEFYFEQSNLAFVRKNGDCYYDVIVSDVKSKCTFIEIKEHTGKTKTVNFATYDCPKKSYNGDIGFAQVDGNGVVLLFSK